MNIHSLTVAYLERKRPDLIEEIVKQAIAGEYDDIWSLAPSSPGISYCPEIPPIPSMLPSHPRTQLTPRDGRKLDWTISLSELAFRQLRAFSLADPNREISGVGLLKYDKPPTASWQAEIEELFFLSTMDGASYSEIASDNLAQLWLDLLKTGRDIGKLQLWFHSHGSMNPFWSHTDTQTIGEYLDQQQQDRELEWGWLISLVTNAEGNHRLRFDQWGPDQAWDNIPLIIPSVKSIELECLDQVHQARSIHQPDRRAVYNGTHRSVSCNHTRSSVNHSECPHGLLVDYCLPCTQARFGGWS